jgi:phosphopantothenoylcysteine decarboxylase/phosphopantothenate--cysteine ligase
VAESHSGFRVLLGVTGGIAAFKAAALTSQLAQNGFEVTVVLTPAAEAFVGEGTFAALSGKRVVKELFDPAYPLGAHIELARQTDLLCIAPATANFLAKAAQGIADDLISTLYLCFTKSVLVAPAMNCEMWNKPAVQRNVKQLVEDGVQFVGPQSGWLSCRDQGVGRMAEANEIFAAIEGRRAEGEERKVFRFEI